MNPTSPDRHASSDEGRRRPALILMAVVVGLIALVCLSGAASPAAAAPRRADLPAGLVPDGGRSLTTEALLDSLQRTAFLYFWHEVNPVNGLIRDRSQPGSPCSIAAQGFGISAICIGIDHGWVSREEGRDRILLGMQTLWNGPQSDAEFGTNGYQGLFYHFLDINSGLRTWSSELSTIDTALLMAGILDAKQYFDTADPGDQDLRDLADSLYYRVDWDFMRNGSFGLQMGWKPATEFSGFGFWIGYNEAMILYILALGSPTHPVPAYTWDSWTSGYNWSTQYGYTYVIFPPLFGHQYSHCWVDFRYIQDAYMRDKDITYFENSRRATLAQREYCIDNPFGWAGYGENTWGLTASDDPDGYLAHGAPPPQNDNGTITPTAVAASIPFAPEVVIPALHNLYDAYGVMLWDEYGFKDAFNLTRFWWGADYLGIDQGPIIIMIENYLDGAVWQRFMANADIQTGLERAGFETATAAPEASGARGSFLTLDQNSPNPFNESTSVAFRLSRPGHVTLRLYDARGRCVRTLVDRSAAEGAHRTTLDARGLPSGVYFYSLESRGHKVWRRCILVR